jgi:predicted enzyme related to lactoylglutathione lyase
MSDYRGRFLWMELMTSDVEAAKAFYTRAIGWGTQLFGDGTPMPGFDEPYALWITNAEAIGGVMKLPEEARSMGAPPHWLAYIGTPDVDASTRLVKELGGQVYVPPTDVPTIGRIAVVADPQGATFALYKPLEWTDTPLAEPKVGQLAWSELLAGSWQEAWTFYERLFGWSKTDSLDMGPMGIYQLFGIGKRSLGGMFTKPADMPAPPHWLYYFRVSDMDGTVERIKAAGGKVLNGPMPVPGGAITQCMDPQGAVFAVHVSMK